MIGQSQNSKTAFARMLYAIKLKLREAQVELRFKNKEIKDNYILYIKKQLLLFFNCGDNIYADRCYNALRNGIDDMYNEVIEYLYDHDDDDYIGRYMENNDVDFPNEKILKDIEKYYKLAYNLYSLEKDDYYPNKRVDDLYENIIKKVDKEVKKAIYESYNNVIYEEWIDVNTNALFVGDICYALNDTIYDDVWINKCGALDGLVTDGNITYAVVGGTSYGDGEYYDEHGNTFGVDSGTIGVTDLTYIGDTDINKLNNIGVVVKVPSKHANVDYYNENGNISIKIWDKISGDTLYIGEINTNEELTNDEDWSKDDEDDWENA